MKCLAPGGRLRLFRSPEPNGEAAPAIFGVFRAGKYHPIFDPSEYPQLQACKFPSALICS